MIFYDFLHNLQESAKCNLLFELQLAVRPLRRNTLLQCGPRGRGRRGSGQIPASAGGGVGWGRARGGAGVARDRFGSELGVEMAGGEACGGAQRRQPLRSKLRRGWGRGERVERLGSFCRG
jgi:hypothetical protein